MNSPKISDAEWEVMRLLWARAPQTASEVIQGLAGHQDWSPKTVRTLLARLVAKGAVTHSGEGRIYHYRPGITESECVREETRSFIQRVFGGALEPMLAHFVDHHDLTPEQIDELQEIVDKARARRKG